MYCPTVYTSACAWLLAGHRIGQSGSAMKVGKIMTAWAVGLMMATSALAANHTVNMLNTGVDGIFAFEPGYLRVQPGDTVTFASTDAGHDSKSFLVPDGAAHWTGDISKAITVTFEQEGIYLYECIPHRQFGMLGVVQVGKAVNKAAAAKAVADMERQQVMNKGRLTRLFDQVK